MLDAPAHLHRLDVHLIVRPHHRHLVRPLELRHGALRHEERARFHLGKHANPRELSRAQNISGIRKQRRDPERAGPHIDLVVFGEQLTGVRIRGAVRQDQFEAQLFLVFDELLRIGVFPRILRKTLLTHGEVGLHRIDLRNCRQNGARADQVADLDFHESGESIHRRVDRRVIEIELRLLHRGALCFRLGARGVSALGRIVAFLFARDFPLKQIRRPLRVHLRLLRGGVCLKKRRLRLGQRRLERPPIDLKKDVVLFHQLTFLIVLRDEITLDPRLNRRVHRGIQLADVLVIDRRVLLLHLGDENLRRRRCGRRFRPATGRCNCDQGDYRRGSCKTRAMFGHGLGASHPFGCDATILYTRGAAFVTVRNLSRSCENNPRRAGGTGMPSISCVIHGLRSQAGLVPLRAGERRHRQSRRLSASRQRPVARRRQLCHRSAGALSRLHAGSRVHIRAVP